MSQTVMSKFDDVLEGPTDHPGDALEGPTDHPGDALEGPTDHPGDALLYAYARVWAADKHVAVVRADTRDNFLADFFTHIHASMQRKRYREEREYPEFVDIGGEA